MHKYSRMVFSRQDFLFPAETQRRRELYHKKPFVLFRAFRGYNYPQYLSAPLNLLCLRVSPKAIASATTTLIRVTPFIRENPCISVFAPQAGALATNHSSVLLDFISHRDAETQSVMHEEFFIREG